jgi:acyl-CoA synthetase (AMP-forming)/AMP-acid ligase II
MVRPRQGQSSSPRTPTAGGLLIYRVDVAHPHVELQLIAGDDGETGEGVLQMRCPALMTEYHNLPEATAKALTLDGFYITGDVFRRDRDGFYYFVGRSDDMFVSGGENVYPGEIEAMLERHRDIHQAVVVPVDDELKFRSRSRLSWRNPVLRRAKRRSRRSRSLMRRPICIRAGYGSCRRCRSPGRT